MSTSWQFDEATSRKMEASYRTTDSARRREAVLAALQLQSGERVLDIGTGPGFLAIEMAEAVGASGQVHCIDTSEPMVALARKRCAAKPWVTCQLGAATDLPAGDGAYDAVVSVQVYEFIPDVEKALSEMFRVLRPGGRAALVSTDWDTIAWNASDRERMRRVLKAFEDHCAHQTLPRKLASRLRRAGLVVTEQRLLAQFNPDYGPDRFSYHLSGMVADFVAGRHGVTEEEAQAWREDLRETFKRGEYFFNLNQYLCMVTKP